MEKIKISKLEAPIVSEVWIPGSKSYTNRALILAAMTKNPVRIINPLRSDDIDAMVGILKILGIEIEENENEIVVIGDYTDVKEKDYELNAMLSGTTIRFITAFLCLVPGRKILTGEEGLNKRPVSELVDGLRLMGAEIEYIGEEGNPPLKITSSKLTTGKTKLNGDVSSQYFSALMMIAPLIGGDIEIDVIGNQISKPYIDMTIDSMNSFGVEVINNDYKSYFVRGGQHFKVSEYKVEGDFSGAGYFAGIAALTGSTITMKNLNPSTAQGDIEFIKILERMGNEVEIGRDSIRITGGKIKSVEVDMESCPDQAQTLAVLCSFAEGRTHMTGIRSLRVKETGRAQAIINELEKMGIKTEDTDDTLTIFGGNPNTAIIDTYGDHRMAMSFAQAGVKLDNGIIINDPKVVSKTFPDFWEKLSEIGIKVEFIE